GSLPFIKKLVLHFLNVLCEIFQRTRSQTTLFLVCGCKGRHFPQYDKTLRKLFSKKNGKILNTHYNIYMGAKRRQKSIAKGNTAEFQVQKKLARKYASRNTEKKGVKRAFHAWQIFFPRHVNEITSGRK
ncbi:MAG: hypothetical protein IIV53_08825, partial [Bacteroidaceae bacterium]|nr:hypothetical protein [Bacteroidaceae bacterium]